MSLHPDNDASLEVQWESAAGLVVSDADNPNYYIDHLVRDPVVPRHLRLCNCVRFCIFNVKRTTVTEAWRLLQTLLDKGMFASIVKLQRVTNSYSDPHIDMWINRDLERWLTHAACICAQSYTNSIINAFAHIFKHGQSRRAISAWRIVAWQPFQDREPGKGIDIQTTRQTNISFMTLNVNGFYFKYMDLIDFTVKHRVAVGCLQETLILKRQYPPIIQGYTTYAQPWEDRF
jgi:hypothetical protein